MYLLITILLCAGSILQIFKGDLLLFLCMQKNNILGYGALEELGQAKITIAVIV
jgi:hypothetical protein